MTENPHPNPPLLTPRMDAALGALAQRKMLVPGLLFLAGHRPVAFVTGQALLVLEPVASLWGDWAIGDWSRLLCHPRGCECIEARLLALLEGNEDGADWER